MKTLVIGGSGSLGRAVIKQLINLGHDDIVVYSRDPSKSIQYCKGWNIQREFGSIEDLPTLKHVIRHHKVDTVVHTAALKYVDVCEKNPSLAIGSIVNGTENVLKAIESVGDQVNNAVLVSSDKACQQRQVYGICKYLTEQLVRQYSDRVPTRLNSFRFGNLFGSSGSVLPIWTNKINKGEEITLRLFDYEWGSNIKDKAALRFAMLPSMAATQVCHAIKHQERFQSGSVLCPPNLKVVDMGVIAQQLREVLNKMVNINVDSVLPGEEQFEQMYTDEEAMRIKTVDLDSVVINEIVWNKITDKGVGLVTRREDRLDNTETREFLERAVKEMLEWM